MHRIRLEFLLLYVSLKYFRYLEIRIPEHSFRFMGGVITRIHIYKEALLVSKDALLVSKDALLVSKDALHYL